MGARGEAGERAPRVLWFSHSGLPGGAELCLVEAVRALADRGWESVVVLPEEGELEALLAGAGARTRREKFSWWVAAPAARGWGRRARRVAGHLARWRHLARVVRQEAPDVVASNTLAVPGGALAARAAGVPHVWLLHEFGRLDHGLEWDLGEDAAMRLVRALSERVTVISDSLLRHFSPWIPPEKLRRLYLSVELSAVPPAPPARPAGSPLELVLVGQKAPGKRQEDAVRAVALLRGRGVTARLVMVGREDPEYGERLRALVGELGLEDRVEVLPFTPEPLRLVMAADAALVCSRMEAMGRVTVEAMKLGKPVVGAHSGGTAELVRDGWNGLAYPPGDVEALARALERLHHDRALLKRLGRNAREWAGAEFTRERYGERLDAVLREAMAARR